MAEQPTVVIVVDDNAGFLKGVARLLALNGIDTRTFASAEALLESCSAQTATCLLLDIHLGGISGIELQRRLAASGSKCPVIFMTANDDEATRNEAVDAGCIAYLRKPFARQVLLDAIGIAVAQRARRHGRGRDEDFSSPPAQIPARAANAPGSSLGSDVVR
jgi:FixJ family two-component response regulator